MSGVPGVTNRLKTLAGSEKITEVGKALFAGGDSIKAQAQQLITAGSVSGKYHVPSAPGEPPNNDTGMLKSHIETTQPAPLRVEVSSNARYSSALENGTYRTAARPFMGPAANAKRAEVTELVGQAVNIAVRRK